ncbi:aldose 1-epimerase family protein [Weissella kandleri]|uniref:aldose 1-epimerase family protein n=1 Tax=Weissella kandleri TaxID=1616 RepID=UPI00387E48AE
MIKLENDLLTVKVNELGAELSSLQLNATKNEYLWQADAKIWGRHAPNLFPIVGRLHDNEYQYQGHKYQMTQHGFARDMTFKVVEQTTEMVKLQLTDNAETKAKYPFAFRFEVTYRLVDDQLNITYHVMNPADETLIFGMGGHPGFNLPMDAQHHFEDYQLEFNPQKTFNRKVLAGPFVDFQQDTTFDGRQILQVRREDYQNDAIILDLQQTPFEIKLYDTQNQHGVVVKIDNAKYAGIWTKADVEAPFLCIEPWWGIADTTDATGNLVDKFGMTHLGAHDSVTGNYSIKIF